MSSTNTLSLESAAISRTDIESCLELLDFHHFCSATNTVDGHDLSDHNLGNEDVTTKPGSWNHLTCQLRDADNYAQLSPSYCLAILHP